MTKQPFLFVAFGGTGDLMGRKLLPALHRLKQRNQIASDFQILAVARNRQMDDGSYRTWAIEQIRGTDKGDDWSRKWCSDCLHYQAIGDGDRSDYESLRRRIEELEKARGIRSSRLFYLALPPTALTKTITALGQVGLADSSGWSRLVVEKPFGHNLASAVELNQCLHRYYDESQIFRIDHYLGKETVQNLLVFRFANPIFESLWNRDRVERVDIVVAEELGVETRAGYYDRVGALRDMVQNHLTQVLCLTAMEFPAAFEADAIRDEKVKVLRSILPLETRRVVFGQYTGARSADREVVGYLEEPGVAPDSRTETYVAIRLQISNWRWQGVPFFLRTGKRLPRRLTQVTVRFRCPPVQLFHPHDQCQITANQLVITLQPEEGFDLHFEVKSPGDEIRLQTQSLNFTYADAFGPLPEAYETLLLDVLRGDQTLFVRADEAEVAWRLYSPLLDDQLEVHPYPAGSWGPAAASRI